MVKDTGSMLREENDRGNTFMLLATRRKGGKMAPLAFYATADGAHTARTTLADLGGYHKIEVWTLAEAPKK